MSNTINPLYPQRGLVIEWEDEGDKLTCQQCGREFHQSPDENLDALRREGCPGDDCPSHWEANGLPHPEHTPVDYHCGYGEDYDAEKDRAYIAFWRQKSAENPALTTEELARRFADEWNQQAT